MVAWGLVGGGLRVVAGSSRLVASCFALLAFCPLSHQRPHPSNAPQNRQIARKKEASRRVKGLREQIGAHAADAAELEAQQQHLQRQTLTLRDRVRKLESQAALKKEALASKIEEHLKDKEAVEAENACQAALAAQHEATVRRSGAVARWRGACWAAWAALRCWTAGLRCAVHCPLHCAALLCNALHATLY